MRDACSINEPYPKMYWLTILSVFHRVGPLLTTDTWAGQQFDTIVV